MCHHLSHQMLLLKKLWKIISCEIYISCENLDFVPRAEVDAQIVTTYFRERPVGFKRFGELILRRPLEGGLAQLTFFLIRPVFLARRNSCDQW